jgi:hypothetical protein
MTRRRKKRDAAAPRGDERPSKQFGKKLAHHGEASVHICTASSSDQQQQQR